MSDAFNTPVSVDPRLLEVLVCPVTRGRLTYDRDAAGAHARSQPKMTNHPALSPACELLPAA